MYLYLTGVVVDEDEVVGVFDVDNASHSKLTREFMRARQERGELVSTADGIPRYMTVTSDGKAYLTHYAGKRVEGEGDYRPLKIISRAIDNRPY
jgi:hypothetical protein